MLFSLSALVLVSSGLDRASLEQVELALGADSELDDGTSDNNPEEPEVPEEGEDDDFEKDDTFDAELVTSVSPLRSGCHERGVALDVCGAAEWRDELDRPPQARQLLPRS